MTSRVQTASEHEWMTHAVRLASDSVASGGGPFGALVVRDGETVATGTNQVTTGLDPTAHAEVVAIRRACQQLDTFALRGCVLVTSCEPCPMCMASALWARVDRVLYTADRHDAAVAGFDDRAFYELFESVEAVWPTPLDRIDLGHRTEPFDRWRAKPDRVEY